MKELTLNEVAQTAAAVVAVALFAAGCASAPKHGYVDPDSEPFVEPGVATLYDVETAVDAILRKMVSDEGFMESHTFKKAEKGSLPVLQIGNIENLTNERVTQKLESARRKLEIALRKTRLFDIVDDAASAQSISGTLADSFAKNIDAGLKGPDNLQHLGSHASADYQMYGRYRKFQDGDRFTYELYLQLIDVTTGKTVWNDNSKVAKE